MRLRSFLYLANPARVVFGAGALGRLPEEVERLGLSRVMVVSTPGREGHARSIAQLLGSRAAGIFARAQMHTPVEVTEAAITTAREIRVDGLVAAGVARRRVWRRQSPFEPICRKLLRRQPMPALK